MSSFYFRICLRTSLGSWNFSNLIKDTFLILCSDLFEEVFRIMIFSCFFLKKLFFCFSDSFDEEFRFMNFFEIYSKKTCCTFFFSYLFEEVFRFMQFFEFIFKKKNLFGIVPGSVSIHENLRISYKNICFSGFVWGSV